ncbi:MAG: hypothetical protein ACI4OA_00960, partial [Selenomonadaceae bacterium]
MRAKSVESATSATKVMKATSVMSATSAARAARCRCWSHPRANASGRRGRRESDERGERRATSLSESPASESERVTGVNMFADSSWPFPLEFIRFILE